MPASAFSGEGSWAAVAAHLRPVNGFEWLRFFVVLGA